MSLKANETKIPPTIEARRLAEVAKAAGLGDSPDLGLKGHREALALLGSDRPTTLAPDFEVGIGIRQSTNDQRTP
jgi:hypothetical protein